MRAEKKGREKEGGRVKRLRAPDLIIPPPEGSHSLGQVSLALLTFQQVVSIPLILLCVCLRREEKLEMIAEPKRDVAVAAAAAGREL